MTVQAQTLTPQQQKLLLPRALKMDGTFDVLIDKAPVDFQTRTLKHNVERGLYGLNGRHADNSYTINEIYIQIPDDVRVNQIIDMAKQEFTDVEVWYAVKSPSSHHTVSCIAGQLVITELTRDPLKIAGTLHGTTDQDPAGHAHTLDIEFDLSN